MGEPEGEPVVNFRKKPRRYRDVEESQKEVGPDDGGFHAVYAAIGTVSR